MTFLRLHRKNGRDSTADASPRTIEICGVAAS
jgi:hypothetical protein